MFLKGLIGLFFAGALALSPLSAEVVVRIAPPRVMFENRGRPPSPNHVWVSGYQRWDGNAYAWTPGEWQQPPRAHAHWQAHHWVRRNGGWVMVEGRWR
jgi:hypothetical protein